MSITPVNYVFDFFFILSIINIANIFFIFIIHFFVPKIMLETYFREPYFSVLEIQLFTGPPYAYMRTGMMMRLAAWPDCGKKRGIPATAHEICPVWFQKLSKFFVVFSMLIFVLLIGVALISSIVFTVLGMW